MLATPHGDPPSGAVPSGAVRAALDARLRRTVAPILAVAAFGYLGLAALNLWTGRPGWAFFVATDVALASLLGALLLVHVRRRGRASAHALVTLVLTMAAASILLSALLDPSRLSVLALLAVGLAGGSLLLSWRWFVVAWFAHAPALALLAIDAEHTLVPVPNLAFGTVIALAVSTATHASRLRLHHQIEEMRIEDRAHLAELERTRAQAMAQDRLSALGTLVAGVAHEINNPLQYMRGNVELSQLTLEDALADPRLPPEARLKIQEILDSQGSVLRGIDRIAAITTSLRRVARKGSGIRTDVDLNALVESALVVAAPRINAHVVVRAELDATRPVHGVESELAQVLLNLLLNAGDAVSAKAEGRITIRTRDDGERVVLEVEDNGEGIPAEDREKLFTPFFTTKAQGTGLGLTLSHRIVTDHDGHISCESRPGQGARFRVELPVVRELPSPAHEDAEPSGFASRTQALV
jgi:signal transduction histidine kinase